MPLVLFVHFKALGSEASKTTMPGGVPESEPPAIKERPKPLVEVVADEAPPLFTVLKLPPLTETFAHVCVVTLNEETVELLGAA